MSFAHIGLTKAAGNAVYATIYTVPATSTAILGLITAYNTTGGALTTTIAVTRQDGTTFDLAAKSVGATAPYSWTSASDNQTLVPLTLLPGEILKAKAAGAGVNVTISGIRFF